VVAIASRPEHQVLFPIEVRFVAADDALLSPAHERETAYIAVHQDRKLDWEPYLREVEAALSAMDGRPHWGKRHFLRADTLSQRYPCWDDFQAVRRRFDPNGAFQNAYTARTLGPIG
jgi:L-gulonolactone oxidase